MVSTITKTVVIINLMLLGADILAWELIDSWRETKDENSMKTL